MDNLNRVRISLKSLILRVSYYFVSGMLLAVVSSAIFKFEPVNDKDHFIKTINNHNFWILIVTLIITFLILMILIYKNNKKEKFTNKPMIDNQMINIYFKAIDNTKLNPKIKV